MEQKRIKELLADEEFIGGLLKLETPEQVQNAFKVKGVETTIDEIKQLKDLLVNAVQNGGELSLEGMDAVAGGSAVIEFWLGHPIPPIAINLSPGSEVSAKLATW